MPVNTTIIPVDSANEESSVSAVSWTAIIAGALASIAVTIILLSLEGWLGFASIFHASSPHAAKAITFVAAAWLIIVQWLSSGIGGYMAGRLRTKWVGVHTHEVFFRDTAHGFLSWTVATVLSIAFALGAVSSIASHAMHRHGGMPSAMMSEENGLMNRNDDSGPLAYYVDKLYRSSQANGQVPSQQMNMQAPIPLTGDQGALSQVMPSSTLDADTRRMSARILMNNVSGNAPDTDRAYLAQLVASRTGLSQADAQKRVDDVSGQMKADEETARKAATSLAFFTFLSLLIGAFIATTAGALGGHLRDEYSAIMPE
jgi:hypothetical protein